MQDSAVVAAADIARLASVGRAAVSNWRRRFDDFPGPVAGTPSNPLFSLTEIEEWLRRQGKLTEIPLEERVWQELRAGVDDLELAAAVARAGTFLISGTTGSPVPASLSKLVADRGPEAAFDYLYERYLETHSRRVAVTSPEVTNLMIALANVAGGSVLDPACGVGTLLIQAAASGATALYGQERDPALAAIARARLRLHRCQSTIEAGDSLREDAFSTLQADAVLCTPPFGERNWGYDELISDLRWTYGLPPRSEPELPWVQHGLFHLRPGGHAVVLMPSAVADRRSGRRIRGQLLRSGALRAVIALPSGAHSGGLGAPHLWVLRKPDSADPIPTHALMIDATELPRDEVHDHVVDRWREFQGVTDGEGAVPLIELLDEIVDLTPARYGGDDSATSLHLVLALALESVSQQIDELRNALDGLKTLQTNAEPFAMTTIAELAKVGSLSILTAPKVDAGAGKVPMLSAEDVLARRPPTGRVSSHTGMVAIQPGDVVVPIGGRSFAVRVVDKEAAEEEAVLGPGLQLLRPDPGSIDPRCLGGFLRFAVRQGPGRALTTASRSDIRRIEMPRIAIDDQRRLGEMFNRLDEFNAQLDRTAEDGAMLINILLRGLGEGTLQSPWCHQGAR